MNTLKVTSISVGLIVANAILGHYIPIVALLLTPFIVGVIAHLSVKFNTSALLCITLVIILILLTDIIVKLTNNGNDFEAVGVTNLFLIIASIIATIITITFLTTTRKHNRFYIILACLLIPTSVCIHLFYFDFLGLVNYKNASATKAISIKNNIFIGNLTFSDKQIIYKGDTLKIVDGWYEKQIIVDHTHLFKKYNSDSLVNYVIHLKSNKKFDGLQVSYKINDADINGSTDIDSVLKFSAAKFAAQPFITFFKLRDTIKNSTVIKQISIVTPFKNYLIVNKFNSELIKKLNKLFAEEL